MDRKRVTPVVALALSVGALWLVGCQDVVALEPRYDGPSGAAVLHPDEGGPFYEPVGFVSNARSGLIHPLDLKHGWLLADDPASPFLWGAAIPTGADRILGDLAVWAPDAETVTLFVADAAFEVLLEVPYVIGVDESGYPIEATAELVKAGFADADDSGDGAELISFSLGAGYAATESWVMTYDSGEWVVTGSRSGEQQSRARFLEPYATDDGSLTFTISGTATDGDQIQLGVDSGAIEHDLSGTVQAVTMLRDAGLLMLSVYNRNNDNTRLLAFDLAAGEIAGRIDLPDGAVPWRMSATDAGDVLYVADARGPAVYEVLLDAADPAASAVRTLPTNGPVADLAWQGEPDQGVEGDEDFVAGYDHLFVAVGSANIMDLYDLRADTWKDVNPYTPEIDGVFLGSPVTGIGRTLTETSLPELGPGGGNLEDRVVAVAIFEGEMLLVEASTGCVAQDSLGPYAYLDTETDFIDNGAPSNPILKYSEADNQSIRVNPCGGIARSEDWTATFDEVEGGWIIDGSLSGVQDALAVEDERYVSDNAAISFLILAGTSPSTDGDQIRWSTVEGIARVNGDKNGDGQLDGLAGEILELPARPVPYSYLAGATGGGWDLVNQKTGVLWPITNTDVVLRVNVGSATIEITWN